MGRRGRGTNSQSGRDRGSGRDAGRQGSGAQAVFQQTTLLRFSQRQHDDKSHVANGRSASNVASGSVFADSTAAVIDLDSADDLIADGSDAEDQCEVVCARSETVLPAILPSRVPQPGTSSGSTLVSDCEPGFHTSMLPIPPGESKTFAPVVSPPSAIPIFSESGSAEDRAAIDGYDRTEVHSSSPAVPHTPQMTVASEHPTPTKTPRKLLHDEGFSNSQPLAKRLCETASIANSSGAGDPSRFVSSQPAPWNWVEKSCQASPVVSATCSGSIGVHKMSPRWRGQSPSVNVGPQFERGGGKSATDPWSRGTAEAPVHDAPLTFCLVALDDGVIQPPNGFAAAERVGRPSPVLQLHGVTREGYSLLLHVHGFLPYFFARRPPGASAQCCRHALDGLRSQDGPVVAGIEEVEKMLLMPFSEHAERLFRITVSSPKLVAACRTALNRGLKLASGAIWDSPVYEGNVAYDLRFLVDVGIGGGSWVEIAGGRYRLRGANGSGHCTPISTAQLEADAHWSALQCHAAEGEWMGLPPLRILSLHISTVGAECQVVAGAAVLQVQGEREPRCREAWAQGLVGAPHAEADVTTHLFESEAALLEHIWERIAVVDPDVLIGYDLLNDHLSCLIQRSHETRVTARRCCSLGRMIGVPAQAKKATFETRQLGKHETKDVNAEGRVLFDVLTIVEREHKLSSYSLSALALRFLSTSRLELPASTIDRLSREAPVQIASIALRDAELSLRIFAAQQFMFRYVEMARVTGLPMEHLLTRGQSIKVFSMLLRKSREHGYVIPPPPSRSAGNDESYEGGAVLEPLSGFYDEPIVTLDFASLYPSIMQRHNLCFSTILPRGEQGPVSAQGNHVFEEVPDLGHRFVTRDVRLGLLPMVLTELLTARAAAKRAMKSAADDETRAVLDGRQLALKVSANSVYGFTGMSVGMLPCQAIAASVTAYGRRMIEHTRNVVERQFSKTCGYESDAKVIYGDTDSVMIAFGKGLPLNRHFELGQKAAELVSREFGSPIKMEFEKVYFPYLLMSKKRYAGVAWTGPDNPGKLDAKGIEVVRRDWCELVRLVVDKCLQLLLRDRDIEAAAAYVRKTVTMLRQGRIDLRLLVISKALVRDGADAYTGKQAHVELAERLRKRDPQSAPRMGDRVPYVIIAAATGTPTYDKAEDPLFVLEHRLPLDTEHYVEHQLRLPVLRIFEPVLGSAQAAAKLHLFAAAGATPLAPRPRSAPSTGPLAGFMKPRGRCLGCRSLLPGTADALCSSCAADTSRTASVTLTQLAAIRGLEADAAQMMSQCMRCEGRVLQSLHGECANVDCPIFFRRFQVSLDLKTSDVSMQNFRLDW